MLFISFISFLCHLQHRIKGIQVPGPPAGPKVCLIVVYWIFCIFFVENISNSLSNCSFLFLFACMSSSCTRKAFSLIGREFQTFLRFKGKLDCCHLQIFFGHFCLKNIQNSHENSCFIAILLFSPHLTGIRVALLVVCSIEKLLHKCTT